MKRELIILAGIIAILSVVLLVQKKGRVNYAIPVPKPFKRNEVTRMTLTQAEDTLVIRKTGDEWRIDPEGFKADEGKISQMIGELEKLSISALVSEREQYPVYDLGQDKKITVKVFSGEEAVRDLGIGKPATSHRHTYVLLGGDKNIYQANGDFRNIFDKKTGDLRDLTVLSFEDEIISLDIASKGEKTTVEKEAPPPDSGPSPEGTSPAPPVWRAADGTRMKSSEIDEMIRTAAGLKADEYISGKSRDEMGKPVYELTLRGSGEYRIALFEKTKDNRYPGISSENPHPFYLAGWKAEKIMRNKEDLTERNPE